MTALKTNQTQPQVCYRSIHYLMGPSGISFYLAMYLYLTRISNRLKLSIKGFKPWSVPLPVTARMQNWTRNQFCLQVKINARIERSWRNGLLLYSASKGLNLGICRQFTQMRRHCGDGAFQIPIVLSSFKTKIPCHRCILILWKDKLHTARQTADYFSGTQEMQNVSRGGGCLPALYSTSLLVHPDIGKHVALRKKGRTSVKEEPLEE